jgi:hypothetical protein
MDGFHVDLLGEVPLHTTLTALHDLGHNGM